MNILVDFRSKKLREDSFKERQLERAIFQEADIKGITFEGANLKNGNFSNTISGISPLKKYYLMGGVLIIIVFIFIILSAVITVIHSPQIPERNIFSKSPIELQILVNTILPAAISITLLISISKNGFNIRLLSYTLFGLILSIATAILISDEIEILSDVISLLMIKCMLVVVFFVMLFLAETLTALFFWLLGSRKISKRDIIYPVLTSILGSYVGITRIPVRFHWEYALNTIFLILILLIVFYASIRLIVKENSHTQIIRKLITEISSLWGTNFSRANLTDATFVRASLHYSDFRGALLIRTNFFHAKGLEKSRLEGTYLEYLPIRLLSVFRERKMLDNLKEYNFSNLNLAGINLDGADLSDLNFSGSDLSYSSLKNTNLSRANLSQTKLYGANLSDSCLTGACIQEWGISADTNLNNIDCKYIFMGLSKDNGISYKFRKPDDEKEIFINYEFSQFISPIISTLGYYHRQYSDPRELNSFDLLDFFFDKTEKSNIIILTFIELASRHPELDIDVVNVEYRSGGRVKVKVFAQGKGDCSKLHSEYNQIYKHISSLSSQDVENLLSHISQQDRGLNVLKKTLESAGATKAYYSEIQQRLFNHLSKHEESSSKLILFFLANPKDTDRLRIDEEIRSIKEKLSPFIPSVLKVVTQEATRGKDLTNALIRNRPKIVHFSAHGALDEGLALEDDFGYMQIVSTETIAKLFYLFEGQVECVVLNACYTAIQAEVINQYVPYVIGMSRAIADQTAITFSTSFYSYLGEGFEIKKAFDLAINRLELEEMDDATIPVIKINTAIIPNQKPDHFDS